jgi:5-hydroxyisourate hydrolase-like protein (transthyretin family)
MRALCLCALLLLTAASGLPAQRIAGQLVSAESGLPIEGGIVTLQDDQGGNFAGTLSDAGGRFALAAPGAGRYRLRAERIGFATVTSPELRVAAGQTVEHRFTLAPQAVSLHGITVRTTRRCRARPDAAAETHALWEQARKALTAVALTESQRVVSFRIRTHEREVDRTGRVLRDRSSARLVMNEYPFRTAPGAEVLRRGFVQQSGDSIVYHGPDAHTLLSDEFLAQHCFAVRRDPGRPGMIGLTFEPVPQRRHLSGVTGALWLDESTAELRLLEYRYTQLPRVPSSAAFGGRLDFERLRNGAWIVRGWQIQVPSYHVARERGSRIGIGVRETGGEVEAIGQGDGEQRFAARAGSIRGTVLDAEEGTPVAGARVYLSGTQHQAVTDADGRFHIAEIRPGAYHASAYHPALEIPGELLPQAELEIVAEAEASLDLRLPGLLAREAARCPAGPGTTMIAGIVRDEATGAGLGGARVELRPAAGGGEGLLRTAADEAGRFRFCGVPPGRAYLARAAYGAKASPELELVVADARVRRDFAIDLRTPVRLVGRVLDAESGRPVASARVRIPSTDHSTLTNAQGRFVLENLPTGEHAVEVTHVGYGTQRGQARVQGTEAVEVTIHLGAQAIAIEGVTATATARAPAGLEDFHRRRSEAHGRGVFLDRAALEVRGANRVEHLLTDHGFVTNESGVINSRGWSGFAPCGPRVFIDGQPATDLSPSPAQARDALRMVPPGGVEAIEIYRGASQVPPELGGTGGGCGVVAVWTRRTP